MKTYAVVLAGGIGSRLVLEVPKQFYKIEDKPIIIYTLEKLEKNKNIDEIIIVCLKGYQDVLNDFISEYKIHKVSKIVSGGESGIESCLNGIHSILDFANEEDNILIHDANRPLIDNEIIDSVIEICNKKEKAVCVIECNDILALNDNNGYTKTIDRDCVKRIQKPECYKVKFIKKAIEYFKNNNKEVVAFCDIFTLMEEKVYFSEGKSNNIKITRKEDLEIFKSILGSKYEK